MRISWVDGNPVSIEQLVNNWGDKTDWRPHPTPNGDGKVLTLGFREGVRLVPVAEVIIPNPMARPSVLAVGENEFLLDQHKRTLSDLLRR